MNLQSIPLTNAIIESKKHYLSVLPASLKNAIIEASQQSYEELYETDADCTVSLQYTLNKVLESFKASNQTLTHIRYVWMALILSLAVKSTIKHYLYNDSLANAAIDLVEVWLILNSAKLVKLFDLETQLVFTEEELNNLFDTSVKNQEISNLQAFFEALDVCKSTIKAFDCNQSEQMLLNILDNCLEGYAIFPGSYGRRELFDWWLSDVVPSSWRLLTPRFIYSESKLRDAQDGTLPEMNKLEEINSAMWSILLKNVQAKIEPNKLNASKFDSALKNINVNFKIEEFINAAV